MAKPIGAFGWWGRRWVSLALNPPYAPAHAGRAANMATRAIAYCNETYRTGSYLQKFADRAKSNSFKQSPVVGTRKEESMAWTTPTLVEICIGLEINGYL